MESVSSCRAEHKKTYHIKHSLSLPVSTRTSLCLLSILATYQHSSIVFLFFLCLSPSFPPVTHVVRTVCLPPAAKLGTPPQSTTARDAAELSRGHRLLAGPRSRTCVYGLRSPRPRQHLAPVTGCVPRARQFGPHRLACAELIASCPRPYSVYNRLKKHVPFSTFDLTNSVFMKKYENGNGNMRGFILSVFA